MIESDLRQIIERSPHVLDAEGVHKATCASCVAQEALAAILLLKALGALTPPEDTPARS